MYEARERSKTGRFTVFMHVVFSTSFLRLKSICSELLQDPKNISTKKEDYPLAVKMMFNYDVESNSTAILRSMYRELVPSYANTSSSNFGEDDRLYCVTIL